MLRDVRSSSADATDASSIFRRAPVASDNERRFGEGGHAAQREREQERKRQRRRVANVAAHVAHWVAVRAEVGDAPPRLRVEVLERVVGHGDEEREGEGERVQRHDRGREERLAGERASKRNGAEEEAKGTAREGCQGDARGP